MTELTRNVVPEQLDEVELSQGDLELSDRAALRRVAGLSTELTDVTEVEYRQLRLERVVLVGVWTEGSAEQAQASLTELARLAETAGSQVLDGLIQRRGRPDPATFIGSGKVAELGDTVRAAGADDYERVMKSAAAAFAAWRDVPAPRRGEGDDVAARTSLQVHRALGLSYGVVAALLARRGLHPLAAGVAAGAGAFALVDEALLSTVLPPPTAYPVQSHLRGAVGHLALGTTAGLLLTAARRR